MTLSLQKMANPGLITWWPYEPVDVEQQALQAFNGNLARAFRVVCTVPIARQILCPPQYDWQEPFQRSG
jgi:hypothetical protein